MQLKAITSGVALAAMMAITPAANAQSSYWSYDGQTNYSSYSACEEARSTRTMNGAAIGGLLGAGAGAMAGGDDTRNAIVGAMIGAAAGGIVGNRQIQCSEYQYPSQSSSYSTTSNTRYVSSQPTYGHTSSNGYYSNGQYNNGHHNQGYQTTYPSRSYTTTRTHTNGYSNNNRYGSSTYNNGYNNSGYQSGRTYTTSRTYSSQPTYSYGNNRSYGQNGSYSNHGSYQSNSGYNNGYHTGSTYQTSNRYSQPTYSYQQPATQRWSYDGETMFRSYGECDEARRSRTLAGGGIGALAGAGLGAMAGGDDTRNAAVGAVVGGVIGAYAGQRTIQCSQY